MQKGSKIQTQVDPVGEVEYKLIVQQAQESRTLSGAVAAAAIGLMLDGMLRCKEAVAARGTTCSGRRTAAADSISPSQKRTRPEEATWSMSTQVL